MAEALPHSFEFHPETKTAGLSDQASYMYEQYYNKLRQYHMTLPAAQQQKISNTDLKELANCLIDGSVFQIVKELEDIQQLTERDLLNKRVKLVSQLKNEKLALSKRHKGEVEASKSHTLPLLSKQHEEEMAEKEAKIKEELKSMDQNIILTLDQLVTDQQSTMKESGVPLFSITNNAGEIQLQMQLLKFIEKLSHLPVPNH